MPTINIFNPGTVGVDLKSNPLFLKNEKAHSAVNLRWEEGRCFTRPGFRYHSLGFAGQFQGACLFTPALGISAQTFALPLAGLVTVVGGKVRVNDATGGVLTCNPVTVACGDGFTNRGEVNVFGAENHLIIQNRNANTFWWNGSGAAVESPGMDDQTYWVDDEVPCIRFTSEVPEADIPECDKFPCEGDVCTLEISDTEVTSATTATFKITNSGVAAATVTGFLATPPTGVSFDPAELTIEAGTDEEVTVTSASHDLEVHGLDVEVVNSCGTVEFNIPPIPVEPDCVLVIEEVFTTSATTAVIRLRNDGVSTINGILIDPAGGNEWGYSPALPQSIEGGDTLEILVNSVDSELYGVPFDVLRACSETPVSGSMPASDDSCSLTVEAVIPGPLLTIAEFTITNLGPGDAEVTGISFNESIDPFVVWDPAFPIELDPGEEIVVTATTASVDLRHLNYSVANGCGDPVTGATGDALT